VITQVTADSLAPRSPEMRGIDTARIVMVKPTVNRPNSTVQSTIHG
jgi:hypothetical protein